MASGHDAQVAGEKIEALLGELASNAGPQVAETAEELVSCLVEVYGAGLAQIVKIVGSDPHGAGPRLLDGLVADPLVESLLLVHDLHPLDIGARAQRAVDQVLPQFGAHAGQVELLGVDDQGVIHLRIEAAGHGCGSSPDAVRAALADAVAGATPDAAGVDIEVVEAPAELPLLQIGRRPAGLQGARPVTPPLPAAPAATAPEAGDRDRRELNGLAGLVAGLPALDSMAGLAGPRSQDDTAEAAVEHCELCREVLTDRHGHLVDTDKRSLACACRACYLLFTQEGAGGGRYRAVPERICHDPSRPLSDEDWNELQIPVAMAFFFYNSAIGRVVAGYPSPAGPTECELDLEAWDRIAASHPLLREMTPDVEAILVNRTDLGNEVFLIPIDMCYSLVGELRMYWTGFDGGAEVRTALAAFMTGLRHRAVALERRTAGAELGH